MTDQARAGSGLPIVMVFAGSDPTGGAGLQADIEALASLGCHAAPVLTAVTVQDTRDVKGYVPLSAELVIEQARAVLEDMPIAAFKIGITGSVEVIEALHTLCNEYPRIPMVLDPILFAGGGARLTDAAMAEALEDLLLPLATVVTPNSVEARALARAADSLDACAMELLDRGCEYVLITGTHEPGERVVNRLYSNRRLLRSFGYQRLAGSYHGSGCTLAAGIAGLLAQGREPVSAVHEAQNYTYATLKHGFRAGMGQLLPNRFYWAPGRCG